MTKSKIRITVDLTSELNDRLEKLTTYIGSSSKADTIRDALRVLEYFADRHAQGYEVLERKVGTADVVTVDLFVPGIKVEELLKS